MSDHEKLSVDNWLHQVVIGLNLCPFAAYPTQKGRVRIQVSQAGSEEALLSDLHDECLYLDSVDASEAETTLLVVSKILTSFFDYTQFLTWANSHLKREGWQGIYQLASFHPHYCFMGASREDKENLTNRAPFPIIHIIREASLEKAIAHHDDVEGIPDRNKALMEALSDEEVKALFPYLSAAGGLG